MIVTVSISTDSGTATLAEAEAQIKKKMADGQYTISSIEAEVPEPYKLKDKRLLSHRDYVEAAMKSIAPGEEFFKDPTIRAIMVVSKGEHPHYPSISIGTLNTHSGDGIGWYLRRLEDYGIAKPDNFKELMQYADNM